MKATPRPPSGRPRVTVVIPCYNYGHFLPDCVGSVLDQSDVDVDVIVVDDASPDGSVAVARGLAERDPRVRVIAHEVNKRHIATYNEGLAAADGAYVVLLSADDLLAPGSLGRAAALLEAHPDVGLVYGFSRTFADTPPVPRSTVRSWSVWTGPEWLGHHCRTASNPIMTPEVMMRTSTMRELVGYDARLPHAADFLLWLRAATRGSIGRVNGVDQAYYRVHGANMHVEQYSGAVRDLSERHLAFQILFEQDAAHIADADRLRELSSRALAREALLLACQPYERGTADVDTVEQSGRLVALAEEIWPPSRDSGPRRAYERLVLRTKNGKRPAVPPRLIAVRDRVVGHVGWRRWRSTGLSPAWRSM